MSQSQREFQGRSEPRGNASMFRRAKGSDRSSGLVHGLLERLSPRSACLMRFADGRLLSPSAVAWPCTISEHSERSQDRGVVWRNGVYVVYPRPLGNANHPFRAATTREDQLGPKMRNVAGGGHRRAAPRVLVLSRTRKDLRHRSAGRRRYSRLCRGRGPRAGLGAVPTLHGEVAVGWEGGRSAHSAGWNRSQRGQDTGFQGL
jgi:hypothetical protein